MSVFIDAKINLTPGWDKARAVVLGEMPVKGAGRAVNGVLRCLGKAAGRLTIT